MTQARPSRVRFWWPIVALVLVVVAVAAMAGPPDEGLPLDPTSTAATGTRALVETLEGLGVDVDVSAEAPDEDITTVLVLTDMLDDLQSAALEAWTSMGGTLVLTDPLSPLAPPLAGGGEVWDQVPLGKRCDAPALEGVNLVARGPASLAMQLPDVAGAFGCFPIGEGHWLVAAPRGAGTVVALGGPEPFTNGRLGQADNAILAVNLLAPTRDAVVRVLRPPRPGEGDAGLGDLVSPRVRAAGWQLVIAFLLFALYRAWRLGRPIEEPQPVSVAGSELVVAVGNLLQKAEARERAAELLDRDLARELAERLGLPPQVPTEQLAQVVEDRTGVARGRVLSVLAAPPPPDDAALLERAGAAERLRRDILAPAPRGAGANREQDLQRLEKERM